MRLNRAIGGTLSIAALTLAILADAADALARQSPTRLAASVAAGLAVPLDTDVGFNATEWQIAVRGAVSPHVLVEGFFDEWRHSSDETYPGVINRYGSVTQHTVHVTRATGINWLLRGSAGRVSITGGGGPGYMAYQRTFRQDLTDCQSSAAQACGGFQNRWNSSGLSIQGVVGADVPLSSHLAVFGQFKFTGPVSDLYASHTSLTGGIRVGIL